MRIVVDYSYLLPIRYVLSLVPSRYFVCLCIHGDPLLLILSRYVHRSNIRSGNKIRKYRCLRNVDKKANKGGRGREMKGDRERGREIIKSPLRPPSSTHLQYNLYYFDKRVYIKESGKGIFSEKRGVNTQDYQSIKLSDFYNYTV